MTQAAPGPRWEAVVLASRNPHKVTELARILAAAHLPLRVVGIGEFPGLDDVAETGGSFLENAGLKAAAAAQATGLPTIADDSGLTVDALNGMPGIFSARWAGRHGDDEANLHLLLRQLADVADDRRGAAFVCAAVLQLPDGNVHSVQAQVRGRLIGRPRGHGGFGYDPIFVADGHSRTTAELSPGEKDAISHRGQALRALIAVLRQEVG